MHATDILQSEHRVIEQMLLCLEKLADEAARAGRLDHDRAAQALDFFRTFADRCHHEKEEQHLFPLLEARGFSREHGPTGVMLHEHEEGRRLIAALAQALPAAAQGDRAACAAFTGDAHAYASLLREHIRKEDHCLFPMAQRALSDSDQEALQRSFARVEDAREHGALHQKYLQLARDLAEHFGLPPLAQPAPTCCGHHTCSHG
jgi:hemerythrin-like domain-containing protein